MGFDAVAAVLLETAPAGVDTVDLMLNAPLHAAAFAGHPYMVRRLQVAELPPSNHPPLLQGQL